MGRDVVRGDGLGASVGQATAHLLEVLVGIGGEDLGQRRQPGRGGQRVAVERALLGDAVADLVHEVGPPAEGARRDPAGDRLGEAGQVGLDPEALDGTAGGDGGAALHLVEDEHDAVARAQLAHAFEVARAGAARCRCSS